MKHFSAVLFVFILTLSLSGCCIFRDDRPPPDTPVVDNPSAPERRYTQEEAISQMTNLLIRKLSPLRENNEPLTVREPEITQANKNAMLPGLVVMTNLVRERTLKGVDPEARYSVQFYFGDDEKWYAEILDMENGKSIWKRGLLIADEGSS